MPSRRPGPGPERPDDLGQVVGAVERLDHHALDPQVVAPHPLDQLGVVDALDEDAAGPGHPRRRCRARRASPTPCAAARPVGPLRDGRDQA